ncbi:phycobilisome Linker polypeptide [Candidatus Gracilibacteria bacterium]|nr:phycobilisome Linker polypeptide [Candidatus Gracilibacteria bacterium]NJM87131.1 phycobilisome Linker polypeptide [Hydrococcus sp. RU_2_2]NJP19301.1 phycobilisome Linker polypeptide [Hydrococcus sp. CRU_1_1]
MIGSYVSPVIGKASQLGVSLYEDTIPLELRWGASLEDLDNIIRAVYRQVLGNAYVMESERLTVAESRLTNGETSVREFVRQIARSQLYSSRFFDNCPRYRAIELNFKHLLGRAPESYEEMSYHSQILDRGGYAEEIDSYIDSKEYITAFGEYIVPYYRGYKTQTGKNIVGFTHLFQLLRGASSSDKNLTTGNRSRLNRFVIANQPSNVIPPAGVGSYGGMTDVNKLLAEVLKPKAPIQPSAPETYVESTYQTVTDSTLQHQYDQQEKILAQLRSQLAELSSLASIGVSQLSKWQSNNPGTSQIKTRSSINTGIQPSLQQGIEEQKNAIAELETKIADLRRYAAIGEAKLNKWRSRVF